MPVGTEFIEDGVVLDNIHDTSFSDNLHSPRLHGVTLGPIVFRRFELYLFKLEELCDVFLGMRLKESLEPVPSNVHGVNIHPKRRDRYFVSGEPSV